MAKEIKYKLEVLGGYLATFWGELSWQWKKHRKVRESGVIFLTASLDPGISEVFMDFSVTKASLVSDSCYWKNLEYTLPSTRNI